MSIRDDRINQADNGVGGCLMLIALCILAALPAIVALLVV